MTLVKVTMDGVGTPTPTSGGDIASRFTSGGGSENCKVHRGGLALAVEVHPMMDLSGGITMQENPPRHGKLAPLKENQ
jgi:hypothetical protein